MTVFFVRVCGKLFKNIFIQIFFAQVFLALLMLGNDKLDFNQSSGTSGIDLTQLLEMAEVGSANLKMTCFFSN